MKYRWIRIPAAGVVFVLAASAWADCEEVSGRIVSQTVTIFSNGEGCPSALGLCTEGRFSGDLEGNFRFSASTLSPFALQDPASPVDVVAATGVVNLALDELCDGSIVLADTSAFSLSPDGSVGGIETIVSGSGACADLTGRIRIQGIFVDGCIDCSYAGEVCGAGDGDDDDDEDSDSDSDD